MHAQTILEHIKAIASLAQIGLLYSKENYDRERYTEILERSKQSVELLTGAEIQKLHEFYAVPEDYITPKVDVRAFVLNDANEVLMVKEKADGLWSIPGGWADVGHSPAEIAVKEVFEESGLQVKAKRLLGVADKRKHPHPPALHYVYKIFVACEITGGTLQKTHDILDNGFFKLDALPPLSEERILQSQIEQLYETLINDAPAFID